MKDYYKTLGVDKKASKEDIKKAFYKLAHAHHPDKNGGDDKKFKEVNEAYQALSDDKKRAQYDRFGSTGPSAGNASQGGNPFGQGFDGFDFSNFGFGGGQGGGNVHHEFNGDMGDIFGDMFGFGGGNKSRRKKVGEDLQVVIEMTATESILGVSKKINYNRHAKCETCNGFGAKDKNDLKDCKNCSGRGVVNTTKKTIFGNMASQSSCQDCDGFGKVITHKCPDCKGDGVKMKKEEIEIPVPMGVENGAQFTMRGKGEVARRGEAGDLYISIRVKKITHLSKKAKELFEELRKEGY